MTIRVPICFLLLVTATAGAGPGVRSLPQNEPVNGAVSPTVHQPLSTDCSLSDLAACETTNYLVNNDAFQSAARVFLGRRRHKFFFPDRPPQLVSQSLISALGGPPDHQVYEHGLYLFTACRFHSCSEKGAVVIDKTGAIQAAAIRYYSYVDGHDNGLGDQTLAIYMRRHSTEALSMLRAWSEQATASQKKESYPTVVRRIVITFVEQDEHLGEKEPSE